MARVDPIQVPVVIDLEVNLTGVVQQTNFDDVGDFHEQNQIPNVTHGGVGDKGVYSSELHQYRKNFIEEELTEFGNAFRDGELADMFDALLDIVYVAMGTAHFLGLPWQEGWDLVQAANMTKVRATSVAESIEATGRGSIWDVIKPPGFVKPDIRGLLENLGMDPSWPVDPDGVRFGLGAQT